MLNVESLSRPGLAGEPGCFGPARPDAPLRVCVYCGSSPGNDPAYVESARQLGAALAEAGFELVYGGGTDGLMGVVAQAVLAGGGRVTGIIPTFLTHQCRTALVGRHDLVVVDGMHARKQAMFDKADAFIALPGGLGTLEELVEQMTWLKLGRHAKPLIIADIGSFWHPLLRLLDHMETCGFLGMHGAGAVQVCGSVADILAALQARLALPTESDVAPRPAIGNNATLLVETADLVPGSLSPPRHDVFAAR